jgi:hypothetical protein
MTPLARVRCGKSRPVVSAIDRGAYKVRAFWISRQRKGICSLLTFLQTN